MEGDQLRVLGGAVFFTERGPVALAITGVANVLLVSFALFRFSQGDMRNRRELQLVAWHLRQIAPLRDSERPPPPSRRSEDPSSEVDAPERDPSEHGSEATLVEGGRESGSDDRR
jgi:hypothetical protein